MTPAGAETASRMKILPMIFLILCVVLFAGLTFAGYHELPEKVASHFNAKGAANGWEERSSFTLSMVATGFGVPALVAGMVFVMRIFPARFLDVPNAAHWRKPANFRKACDFLFSSSLVFGGVFLIWQTILFRLVVAANRASPPHLNSAMTALSTLPLLAFIVGWVAFLIFRFQKAEETN
jgi:uncharacterized membrane protein